MEKRSLCCGAKPLNDPDGPGSLELGYCPKCGEHTEFCDLVYKVVHDYGGDFVTVEYKEAKERFSEYKKENYDGIRLYEALSTSDDTDEIEWEIIDSYDVDEHDVELEIHLLN